MSSWFTDYHRQQLCLLAEPYLADVWRHQGAPGREAIRQLQQTIAEFVPCYRLVDADLYDDCWLRDTMPLWQFNMAHQWHAWQPTFNGWGGIHSCFSKDRQLAQRLFAERVLASSVMGEGGSFSHNGKWVLVGLSSLLQRNPELSREQLESRLRQELAPLQPVFIDSYLHADETQGHIDNLALFVSDQCLVYSTTDDPNHPDFHACQMLIEQLAVLPSDITKIALPLPEPQLATRAERDALQHNSRSLQRTPSIPLLCSYVNLIVLPDAVIVPQFGLEHDKIVLERLQHALPLHTIRPFAAREFVLAGGGLHCLSAQLPAAMAPLVSAHGLGL